MPPTPYGLYIYVYTLYAICAPAQVPPFDWKHAQLDEVRQFLIQEAAAGRFVPSPNLTLWLFVNPKLYN